MDENVILTAISSVGVPAAISFYLLMRVNETLKELTKVIVRLEARLGER